MSTITCEIENAVLADGLVGYLRSKGLHAADCAMQDSGAAASSFGPRASAQGSVLQETNVANVEDGLGAAIAWLMVNRHASTRCTLRLDGVLAHPFQLLPSPFAASDGGGGGVEAGAADAEKPAPSSSPPSTTTSTTPSSAAHNGPNADPTCCVEIYHLHCHFNDVPGSEAAAVDILESTAQAVTDAG